MRTSEALETVLTTLTKAAGAVVQLFTNCFNPSSTVDEPLLGEFARVRKHQGTKRYQQKRRSYLVDSQLAETARPGYQSYNPFDEDQARGSAHLPLSQSDVDDMLGVGTPARAAERGLHPAPRVSPGGGAALF